eukprot:gene30035-36273_t
MDEVDVIVKEGLLQKKRSRLNTWAPRYFILRRNRFEYYIKQSDSEPKHTFPLYPTCSVSAVQVDTKSKKKQYVFKLIYKIDEEVEDIKEDTAGDGTPDKASMMNKDSKRSGKKDTKKDDKGMNPSTKVAAAAMGGVMLGALTSGIGLLAGMMVVGAAAGGSAMAMTQSTDGKERYVLLAADSPDVAQAWVTELETQIQLLTSHSLPLPSKKALRLPQAIHPDVRIEEVEDWVLNTRWKVYDVHKGLRLLAPDAADAPAGGFACLRANVQLPASPFDAFSFISNAPHAQQA